MLTAPLIQRSSHEWERPWSRGGGECDGGFTEASSSQAENEERRGRSHQTHLMGTVILSPAHHNRGRPVVWPCQLGCSAKRLFLSYVLPSGYMVRLGDWSTQKKFQRYRPINDLGMAIWSFDLFYNVKTAEIGAKIFKINKMAKNHFSR